MERDFTIRKRIKGIYNKTADSFPSDLEYKNYEETIEDVIFNLVNNIDVQLTNKQVEQYQSDHLQQVSHNFKTYFRSNFQRSFSYFRSVKKVFLTHFKRIIV